MFPSAEGRGLDWVSGEWFTNPRLPDATADVKTSPYNRTVVAAGTELFVFGGDVWTETDGAVLDTAHLWHKPARR